MKYLKCTQAYHQIKYRLIKPKRVVSSWNGSFKQVDLIDFPKKQISLKTNKDKWSFYFLNLEHSFSIESVDWSFKDYGMLWTYNLNYFDWLHQADISKDKGLEILKHFYATPAKNNPIILHTYPTSLRIINIAKYIPKWDVKEDWLYHQLVSDLKFLSGRLEYHLLANHLLENAFALYVGGLITGQEKFVIKGKKLLTKELKEQILNDGMHYERSPMYHLVILERLLDTLNFAKAFNDNLGPLLLFYSKKMTSLAMNWGGLDRIPMMQDSAYNIALSVSTLLKYSKKLLGDEFPPSPSTFEDSGYRNLKSKDFNLFADVGIVDPSYQPGHAHADELNFELFYKGEPIIVDTGVSTYEKNVKRQLERSTLSHNCVSVNDANSSDVWSGFRVGKRAKINLLEDEEFNLSAQHNGYNPIMISRYWCLDDNEVIITDTVNSYHKKLSKPINVKGRFHVHPKIKVKEIDNLSFMLGENILLQFQSEYLDEKVYIEEFEYAHGYNRIVKSKVIVYSFQDKIKITVGEIK